MKINEARILRDCYNYIHISDCNKEMLGKRIYEWDVPFDLRNTSKSSKKAFIGLGQWSNTKRKVICIVNKQGIIYFDLKALKRLLKEFE